MDCSFCGIRSSIGYCVECRALVCEQCAVICDGCNKPICHQHVHPTPHNRRLCSKCLAKRSSQFESIITDMHQCRDEVLSKTGRNDVNVLRDQLDRVIGRMQEWDVSLQQAYDVIEERVATRTRELQQEILEHRRTEHELLQAKKAAETAVRSKSEFLANMSHEIRTPMNGVIAMAELLLNSELQPDQRRHVETIRSCGRALLTIIGDILDYSKIEAGRLTIEPISFDLEVAINDVVELLNPRAEEKGLSLIMRYSPTAPRRVVGDAGRIRQILMNLVGNAIKFTEKGYVLVNTESMGQTDDQIIMRISVEDTGIGIPKEKLPVIFRQFAQGDTSTSRKYGGTGLGLAISHQLVNLMGGRIGVKSVEGVGSRFRITLALGMDHEELPSVSVTPENLAGVRVLILDDNLLKQRVLFEQLSNWRMRCEAASTCEEALSILQAASTENDPCQIALITHRMLGNTGKIAQIIKSTPALRDTLLVLLTSSGQRGEAMRIAEMGFSAYLSGPLRQTEFLDALARVWTAHTRGEKIGLVTRHTVAESREITEEHPLPAQSQYIHAHVLVVEDNPVNQEVAVEILRSMGCSVSIAANGEEAVHMSEENNYDLIFMDCQMPKMDGYEATRKIRSQESEGEHVPIIALTAHALKGDRERCLEAGMDDYMAKPVSPDMVATAMMRWLKPDAVHLAKVGNEAGEETTPAQPAEESDELKMSVDVPMVDFEQALATTGGRASILDRVTKVFLENVPAEAEQLGHVLEEGNIEEARRIAHSIKSAAAALGGTRVSELAKHIEFAAKDGDLDHGRVLFTSFMHEFTRFVHALESVNWEAKTIAGT